MQIKLLLLLLLLRVVTLPENQGSKPSSPILGLGIFLFSTCQLKDHKLCESVVNDGEADVLVSNNCVFLTELSLCQKEYSNTT